MSVSHLRVWNLAFIAFIALSMAWSTSARAFQPAGDADLKKEVERLRTLTEDLAKRLKALEDKTVEVDGKRVRLAELLDIPLATAGNATAIAKKDKQDKPAEGIVLTMTIEKIVESNAAAEDAAKQIADREERCRELKSEADKLKEQASRKRAANNSAANLNRKNYVAPYGEGEIASHLQQAESKGNEILKLTGEIRKIEKQLKEFSYVVSGKDDKGVSVDAECAPGAIANMVRNFRAGDKAKITGTSRGTDKATNRETIKVTKLEKVS